MAESWFTTNRQTVAAEIDQRVRGYGMDRLSGSVEMAVDEACAAYASGKYLTVVRILQAEFEAVARSLVNKRNSSQIGLWALSSTDARSGYARAGR